MKRARDRRGWSLAMAWAVLVLFLLRVSVLRATPDPTITVASDQATITATKTVKFSVTFTEAVTGLRASDFSVHAGKAGVSSLVLTGGGVAYELVITLGNGDVRGCPAGYLATSDDPVLCAKSTPAGTWSQVNDACAPFALSSAASARQVALVAQAAAVTPLPEHWYVCAVAVDVPAWRVVACIRWLWESAMRARG